MFETKLYLVPKTSKYSLTNTKIRGCTMHDTLKEISL